MIEKFAHFTIKAKLTLIAVFIAIIWIILGIVLYRQLDRLLLFEYLTTSVNEFSSNIIQLREAENNFLLTEQMNSYFYTTGKSDYIENFQLKYNNAQENLNELYANQISKEFKLFQKLELINRNLQSYRKTFLELSENIRERGYLDYGLMGEMNLAITKLENIIGKHHDKAFINEKILILRKYEKDFLSLKDITFSENFNNTVETYQSFFTNVRTALTASDIQELIDAINNYSDKFEIVVNKTLVIGLTPFDGLTGQSQKNIDQLEKEVENLLKDIKQKNRTEITSSKYRLISIIIILAISIVFTMLLVIYSIITPVEKIKIYISHLAQGKFPEDIKLKNNDEIAEMANFLNQFVENLRQKARFSESIGEGLLDTDFVPVSYDDTLGNSLIRMRESLKSSALEQQKRKIEDDKLNWSTTGLTKFNDILRKQYGNLEELSYDIISNLVSFLGANQGGLFIVNDEDKNKPFLELAASYAFNKKRMREKTVMFKEGIVGTCAVEKATTYIRNLPDDYLSITSGLGSSNPNNLLVVPLILSDVLFGVVEIASFKDFLPHEIEFIEKLAENIAATISVEKTNINTSKLLQQFQQQSEDLAAKEEEMRQNLEELQSTQENLLTQQEELKGLRFALDRSLISSEYSTEGKISRVNKLFIESLGYKESELINQSLFNFYEGRQREEIERIWENLLTGKYFMGIVKQKTRYGVEKWYYSSYIPIKDKEGNLVKIYHFAQDISEVKNLEVQYYSKEAKLEIAMQKLQRRIRELEDEKNK